MTNTKLNPVLTEKSFKEAKKGYYTFWVDPSLNKGEIRNLIQKAFDVHVVKIKTMNFKKEVRKNFKGQKITKKALKKAMVSLKDKEKIDIFEEKGK